MKNTHFLCIDGGLEFFTAEHAKDLPSSGDADPPCACYPEHCIDDSHAMCWCDPDVEDLGGRVYQVTHRTEH
jgi:hypothetical protein